MYVCAYRAPRVEERWMLGTSFSVLHPSLHICGLSEWKSSQRVLEELSQATIVQPLVSFLRLCLPGLLSGRLVVALGFSSQFGTGQVHKTQDFEF